jgi:hypothetical protein
MSDADTYNLRWNTASILFNEAEERLSIAKLDRQFAIVRGLGAKLGKDGNQWYYIVGELPEQDCIVGFGDTPAQALHEFCKMFEGST